MGTIVSNPPTTETHQIFKIMPPRGLDIGSPYEEYDAPVAGEPIEHLLARLGTPPSSPRATRERESCATPSVRRISELPDREKPSPLWAARHSKHSRPSWQRWSSHDRFKAAEYPTRSSAPAACRSFTPEKDTKPHSFPDKSEKSEVAISSPRSMSICRLHSI